MRIAVAGGTGTVGRHVVAQLTAAGHDPVALARSKGVDLVEGEGLDAALKSVSVVIDVSGTTTQSAKKSEAFFGAVTGTLLRAEAQAGVAHHVALGIVGSEKAPFGYYAGKMVQERLIKTGATPWTILRTTQFHEFVTQIYGQFTLGPFILIPKMLSQPIAARDVAARLVELALGAPHGHARDLAGPEVLSMVAMASDYARASGRSRHLVQVPIPGGFGKAMRNGTVLPSGPHDTSSQTFAEWLGAGGRL